MLHHLWFHFVKKSSKTMTPYFHEMSQKHKKVIFCDFMLSFFLLFEINDTTFDAIFCEEKRLTLG